MQAKTFAVVCFALLSLALLAPHPALAGPVESSVWIEVERADGVFFKGHRLPREGIGAGVMLFSREVVTAAHVVFGANKVSVAGGNGPPVAAKIVSIDENIDVAVLELERPRPFLAAIRKDAVVVGERVSVVERPVEPNTPTLSYGVVGTTHYISNGVAVPLIFTGIKGEKGMSGGGLFDRNGALVGIIIRIDGTLGYLSALPITEFCARLARCGSGAR